MFGKPHEELGPLLYALHFFFLFLSSKPEIVAFIVHGFDFALPLYP